MDIGHTSDAAEKFAAAQRAQIVGEGAGPIGGLAMAGHYYTDLQGQHQKRQEDKQLRGAALEAAIRVVGGDAETVLTAAIRFEAYLRGDTTTV